MLKRFLVGALLICLIFSISSCASNDTPTISGDPTPTTNNDPPLMPSTIETFYSFAEFEQHEKSLGEKALSHYFVPAKLSDEYEFSEITKRENVYVTVEYRLNPEITTSSYEMERLNTLICQYELFTTNPQYTIEKSYIPNGYKAVEYKGKTYYRLDEYAQGDAENQLLGYGIVFAVDDCLIYMHLPAADTFENMMQYTNLQKVTIK